MVLGGSAPGDRSSEAEAGRAWLVADGIPEADVVASPVGTTTLESLRAAAGWMDRNGMRTAFLVSGRLTVAQPAREADGVGPRDRGLRLGDLAVGRAERGHAPRRVRP